MVTFMGPTKFVFTSFITPSALRIRMSKFHDPRWEYIPKLLADAVCDSTRVVDKNIDATPYGSSFVYALFYLSDW